MFGKHLAIVCFCVVLSTGPTADASLADSKPLQFRTYAAGSEKPIPLTEALSQVGLHIQGGNYVLFGVEIEGKEPVVVSRREGELSLEEALAEILGSAPDYTYAVVDPHLISVRPKRVHSDNPLNLKVRDFHVENAIPGDIVANLQAYVPELSPKSVERGSLGPGLRGTGRGISVHAKDMALRDILNRVVTVGARELPNRQPIGWVFFFRPGDRGSAKSYSSRVLYSAPSNWRRPIPTPSPTANFAPVESHG